MAEIAGPRVRMVLAAVVAALAAGCTAAPAAPGHQPRRSTAPAAPLSKVQACRQLRDDLARHEGRSAVPGLRRVADHVTDPRMAGDARTAIRDIDHTGGALVALTLLRDDCAHAGVRIPPP